MTTLPVPLRSPAYRLSTGLVVAATLAAGGTFALPGILRGPAAMNGCARGTALVVLALAVPGLVWSMVAVRRGSVRAVLGWLGTTAYLLYNSVLFLLGTPANRLFLLYLAMFGLALWSVVALVRTLDLDVLTRARTVGLPVRAIAGYAWVIVAVNALVWLKGAVPGSFTGGEPGYLAGTGLTTNPSYIQDLAFWLPLTAVAARWLWRGNRWGLPILGGMLIMLMIESVGVAVDQTFGYAADHDSPVASATVVPGFLALAVIGLVPVVLVLRHLAGRAAGGRRADRQPARSGADLHGVQN